MRNTLARLLLKPALFLGELLALSPVYIVTWGIAPWYNGRVPPGFRGR